MVASGSVVEKKNIPVGNGLMPIGCQRGHFLTPDLGTLFRRYALHSGLNGNPGHPMGAGCGGPSPPGIHGKPFRFDVGCQGGSPPEVGGGGSSPPLPDVGREVRTPHPLGRFKK